MEIGTPERVIQVEPAEEPVPAIAPPAPVEDPERESVRA